MKKFNFSKLFFAAALVASFVMLSACKPAPDGTNEGGSTTTATPATSTSGSTNASTSATTTTVNNYVGLLFINENDPLVGKWVDSTKAVYEISKDTFKNYGETYDSYAGNELCVKKDSDTAGIIYIKYTKAATANWTYSEDKNEAPDVGKWYAIAYKDLSANGIFISGAWGSKDGHKKTSTETLKEAVEEFTLENGYFDFTYGECTRKKD